MQADIIIWDFDTLQIVQRLKLHKVLIQSLSFSNDEKYLASLGGQDDNQLVIWEVSAPFPSCARMNYKRARPIKLTPLRSSPARPSAATPWA